MPSGTIGGYNLALFMRLASINHQFREMLVKSEVGIGDTHVIPTELIVPPHTPDTAPPPWMRATIGAPYLSPVAGVQGVVQFNLPLSGGTLCLLGDDGEPQRFDLGPISSPGAPPRAITLCWQVNLKKAGLDVASPLAPKAVTQQLEAINDANVFSVQVLFADFENANFIDSASVLPDKLSDSLGLSMHLQEVLNWYVAYLAKPGHNPYVLGYGLSKGDAPPAVDAGPFTPQSVDFTLSTDKSQVPVPTLDYWVVTKGGSEPPPADRARIDHVDFDPSQDGAMKLNGDVFIRPLLDQIASAVGVPASSLGRHGNGWGNGASYDPGAANYQCVNVQVDPRGAGVDITLSVHIKKSDSKKLSDIIGGLFSAEQPAMFDWNPFHHVHFHNPIHHLPDPFHHIPNPIHHLPDIDPEVKYWATTSWTRVDRVTFSCDPSGAISASYTRGASTQTTHHGANQSGKILHKIEGFLDTLANGLTRGLNWVFNNTDIPVHIPSVDLSPGISSGGFRTPDGVATRVPFMMPSGGVLIPSDPRWDGQGHFTVDVRYNTAAS